MILRSLPSQPNRARTSWCSRVHFFAALLPLALLANPLAAFAAGTFYVDNTSANCSETGAGTEAQPYCSITAAITARKGAGTTILVKPGIYREMVTVSASGAAGNPFVIKALGPVTVDGADDVSGASRWTAYSGNIYLASSVTWGPMQVFVDGVRLAASTASPAFLPTNSFVWVSGQGLYVNIGGSNPGTHVCLVGHRTSSFVLSGRSYVTIDGFIATRTDDRAIRLGSSSNYCVIRNNTCTWNYKYGIYISGCSNDVIEKNTVSDNANHGINLSNSSTLPTTNCTIQDNESFRNSNPAVRMATGILVIGSPNNLIQRNRLHDNQDSGLQIDTGSDNCLSIQNRSWSNGDHGYDQLYCNAVSHIGDVAYNNFKDGFSIEGTAPNAGLYNCIAINNGLTTNEFDLWVNDASSVGFHGDYNIFWNSTSRLPIKFINIQYSTIAAFTTATGQDAHSTQADPKFLNPALGDFHLQPGSPAIDAANSGVANWPANDADGAARRDAPTMPNVGAGPVTYADRGALEFLNNIPPSGSLVATPNSGVAPLGVTLDASGSYDPDGSVTSYTFDFGDGSPVVGPQSLSSVTHTYLKGNWVAIVTVTDNNGSTAQGAANVTVTGSNLGPVATIVSPAGDLAIAAGQAVQLTGTAIDPDNNYPLSYAWNLGGGAPNQTALNPGQVIFNTPGSYTVTFSATDALGEPDRTPDVRLITVNPAPIGQAPDEVHYTMTSQTSVTFDWRGFDNTIRYGTTTAYGQTVTGVTPSPIPFSSAGPFWEARIPGLQENTTYHYSIGSGADHTFHTPQPRGTTNFKVYAEGDVGDSTHWFRMAAIQNHIAADPPSFALLLGDLAYGNINQLKSVDAHFNDVMKWSQDVPYMPAWGNHEWEGGAYADNLQNYKGRFDLPNAQSSPGSPDISCCGEDWYWFDYGNVRFIGYPEPWSGALTDWNPKASALMDQAQADPAIKFIVTFGHRPAYSSGYHPSEIPLQTILNALGATHSKYVLNLNGHSHDYERSYPQNGVTHITAGTGGADLEESPNGGCLWLGGCPAPAWSAFRAYHHVEVRLTFSASNILVEALCGPVGDNKNNVNDVSCAEGTVLDSDLIGDLPPVVSAPASVSTAENSAVAFDVTASDPDGQPINTLVATGLPAGATFTPGPGNTSGHLAWTPTFAQAGNYSVTFTAANALSGSATTTFSVSNVDRAPVVSTPATAAVAENSPLSIAVTAADSDGDAISSLTASGLPPGATFTAGTGNTAGTLSWTPTFAQSGSYT
ncbi:MAG: PKD domain-containing protein, partial [Candidatus Eiseniibacteriota bacterium]